MTRIPTHSSVNARLRAALLLGALLTGASRTVPAQTATVPLEQSAPDPAKELEAAGQVAAPALFKVAGLTITGSMRARVESWGWFDAPGFDGRYDFGAVLLRVGIGQQRQKVDWQVEGASSLLLGLPDHAIAPAPAGQLGLGGSYFAANGRQNDAGVFLKQAQVRFNGLGGDKASSLRVGRFEFSDGAEVMSQDSTLAAIKRDRVAQRLIGNFGFSHVQRSFDGVHYVRQSPKNNVTFMGARATEGVFQVQGMKELDVDVYYGAFTRQWSRGKAASDARGFVLHYHDGRDALKVDNRSSALRTADRQDIRLTSLGGHYLSEFAAGPGKGDVLLWGVGQVGTWGALDHRASAVAVEAGYQPSVALKPWFRAGYFRGSGDNDATDGRHGTFFQVLPTSRIYARFPFYNLMNNEDTFAELTLRPDARVTFRSDAHRLRLSNRNDLWYGGGGAFQATTFGYAGRPSNGNKSLATLLDTSMDYQYSAMTSFTFYLAGALGRDVPSLIYPTGTTAVFTYIEFTRRF